jgi:hypothetical protein
MPAPPYNHRLELAGPQPPGGEQVLHGAGKIRLLEALAVRPPGNSFGA